MKFFLSALVSGQVSAPAGEPAAARIRASPAMGRRCAAGGTVRSVMALSVLPGQQEQ
jgi:hypothetical protein